MINPVSDQKIKKLKVEYWSWFTEETSYLAEWTYKIFELEKDFNLMKKELERKKKLPNKKNLGKKNIGLESKVKAVIEKYYDKKMAKKVEEKLGEEKWKVFSNLTFLKLKEEIVTFQGIRILLKKTFRGIKEDTTYNLGREDFKADLKELLLLNPDRLESLSDKVGTSTKADIKKKFTGAYNKFRGSSFIRNKLFKYFPTCPYCNFNYLSKLEEKDDGNDYYALEVDHYYPKDKYPYLAISIFNLVPSCPTCNGIKNNNASPHLNPYYEEMGEDGKFQLTLKCIGELTGIKFEKISDYKDIVESLGKHIELVPNFEEGLQERVKVKINDGVKKDRKERIENSKKIFQLENKYSNATHEIKDLYFKHLLYSRKGELMKYFGDELGLNERDMKNIYFGTTDREEEHRRPLSKFTNDIIDFLGYEE